MTGDAIDLRERIAATITESVLDGGGTLDVAEVTTRILALISGPEPELVAEIDALYEKATPRPWVADCHVAEIGTGEDDRAHVIGGYGNYAKQCLVRELSTMEGNSTARQHADAKLIATLVTNWPALKQSLTTQGGEACGFCGGSGEAMGLDGMEPCHKCQPAHDSSDGWRAIDPERWFNAQRDTEYHRSQVQGFLYDTPTGAKTDKPKHHVIRDCTKKPGKQVIWSAFGDDDDYFRLDAEMDRQIELYCIKLIADQYAQPPKHSGGETDG